jgi:hypothetical protein
VLAAAAFDDQLRGLARAGARGTLVLVCELAGRELAVAGRAIGP